MNPVIVEKWIPVIKKIPELIEKSRTIKALFAHICENHFKTTATDQPTFTRFELDILKNVVPFFKISRLIGIQPVIDDTVIRTVKNRLVVEKIKPQELTFDLPFDLPFNPNLLNGSSHADKHLILCMSMKILRNIERHVVDTLYNSAIEYSTLDEALEATDATWLLGNRTIVDKYLGVERIGSVFENIVDDEKFEGGYRSAIRDSGVYQSKPVFVSNDLESNFILVGRKGITNYDSGLVLGLDLIITKSLIQGEIISPKLCSMLKCEMFDHRFYGKVKYESSS